MDNRFKSVPVLPSEITPKSLYLSRRDFIKAAGLAAGSALLAACAPQVTATPSAPAPQANGQTDELGDPVNTFEDITNYNNYYEFTTDKQGVAPCAAQGGAEDTDDYGDCTGGDLSAFTFATPAIAFDSGSF